MRIRVLIIDTQTLFTDRIERLLEQYSPNIQTVFSDNIFSAFQCIQDDAPIDLVLLNINENAPENSYDLIRRLYALHTHVPIVVISNIDSIEAATWAIENKVSGFISPDHNHDVILDSIIYSLEEDMFSNNMTNVKTIKVGSNHDFVSALVVDEYTLKEKIFDLLYKGRMNNQIAEELNVCCNTVNIFVHEILRTAETDFRAQA